MCARSRAPRSLSRAPSAGLRKKKTSVDRLLHTLTRTEDKYKKVPTSGAIHVHCRRSCVKHNVFSWSVNKSCRSATKHYWYMVMHLSRTSSIQTFKCPLQLTWVVRPDGNCSRYQSIHVLTPPTRPMNECESLIPDHIYIYICSNTRYSVNNIHVKITRFWLAKSSAVQV